MHMTFFELCAALRRQSSDGEAALALKDYLTTFGAVDNVHTFNALGAASDRRCFLVIFAESAAACSAANQLKLRSFAFNGVLVEL
jgi:hypothetical protein